VQTHINGYGAAFAAGMSASGKVFGLLETACIALAQATATFVSQNYGAKRFDRIRQGVKNAIGISLTIATILIIVMMLCGRMILRLFVAPEAMETAWGLLRVMSFGLWIAYPMYSLRQAIQALGNAVIPLIAAIVQIFARVLVTIYFPKFLGPQGMYFTTVTAWVTSIILIGAVYPVWFRKCERESALQA
jgi:Na+-driven multidrug efflux pump